MKELFMNKEFTYQKVGVDIKKVEKSLLDIKELISKTHNNRVLKNIGAFGGFFEFPIDDFKNPVLISSTDGVGTKLKVAVLMKRHNTVGQDLVNHCINDIAVCGATPLFFLDYFGCGVFDDRIYREVMEGFSSACSVANLPLIGGETAEMPGLYKPGEYDLVGTIVGSVEKEEIIDGQGIQEGDEIIGIQSNGLHTNGYSLAREVLFPHFKPERYIDEIQNVLGDELLKTHLNYFPIIKEICQKFHVKGIAHITGGGLYKNTIRIVPRSLDAIFDWAIWPIPPIFQLIQNTGNVPVDDMRQTFNLGIGLTIIVDKNDAQKLLDFSKKYIWNFYRIGKIIKQKK
jgi:phosphoribosylformylglycinamidine cyclo-ligase